MYQLSKKSLSRLEGLHPDLQAVVKKAITLASVDFTVLEGLRSASRQKQLVADGASKTLNSRHLTGHAVDLGAWVLGAVSWDWGHYYKIAEAVRAAAGSLDVALVWGGVWDRPLQDLTDTEQCVKAYVARRRALGKDAFIDGPHFELSRRVYP